jgi:hypothetical protein
VDALATRGTDQRPEPVGPPGRRLGRWFAGRWSPIRFSPFDLRVYLRLVVGLLVWKVLSTDYGALPALGDGIDLIPYQSKTSRQLVHAYQRVLLNAEWKVVATQLTAAALLAAAAVRVRRWALVAGLVPVLLIEWCAYQYRGYIWSFEIPLSVLTIMALWPAPWSEAMVGGRTPTRGASRLGFALALNFGLAYFFCGLSKFLATPSWFANFSTELFYFGRNISKGPVPTWLEPVSAYLTGLFIDFPWAGEVSRRGVLGVELLWFVGLFWRWGRWTLPYLMFGTHVVFFLSVGFTFIPFAGSAVAIMVPWRTILPGRGARPAGAPPAAEPADGHGWFVAALAVVALAVIYPVWNARTVYPFPNFNVFGWSNRTVRDQMSFYHLAYADPETGEVKRIPMYHGGFLDYTQWHVYAPLSQYYTSPDPAVRAQALKAVRQFVRALRPYRSNAFLLGPLTMPDHVMCAAEPVDPAAFRTLYVLRYDYHVAERGLTPVVTNLGPLPEAGAAGGTGLSPAGDRPPGRGGRFTVPGQSE